MKLQSPRMAKKKYEDENVLVISRDLFDELGSFQGLSLEPWSYLGAILAPANNYFLDRNEAEDDPSHKQIIPYVIFQAGDKYLHYVRGAKGGEKRLASKGSLGIGGHVNDTDVDPENRAETVDKVTYTKGVEREIREELKIVGPYTQRIVALINDDSNAVGKVHLGVVHLIQLESENVKANEASIEKLEFLDIEELTKLRKKMESWSQICFDGFIGLLE